MAVRRLDPLPCLVGNEIGSDKACASCIREISGEAFNPIMVDEVPVAHDERHSTGIGHRLHGLEHIGYALAIVQAIWLAAWITGPSITGSEYGSPISTMSAPFSTIVAKARVTVPSWESEWQVPNECRLVLRFEPCEQLAAWAGTMADSKRLTAWRGVVFGHICSYSTYSFTRCCRSHRSPRVRLPAHR